MAFRSGTRTARLVATPDALSRISQAMQSAASVDCQLMPLLHPDHPHLRPAFAIWRPFQTLQTSAAAMATHPRRPSTSAVAAATETTEPLRDLTVQLHAALTDQNYAHALRLFKSSPYSRVLLDACRDKPSDVAAAYDAALKACAATASADEALRLVAQMWRRKVPVGRVAQGSVLKALCSAGRIDHAWSYLKKIPSTRLNVALINTVLGACATAGNASLGLKCWELCLKRGLVPDALTWSLLLRLHGHAGSSLESVQSTWESARNSEAWLDGDDAERASIGAALAYALASLGEFDAALLACEGIMDELNHLLPVPLDLPAEAQPGIGASLSNLTLWKSRNTTSGTTADLTTASTTTRTSRHAPDHQHPRSSHVSGALAIRQLRAACNAVLHAAEVRLDWPVLRRLAGLMTRRGLPPDATAYHCLLKASWKRGDGRMALSEGIQEMQTLGSTPTAATYELLMEAAAKEGDADGVRRAVLEAVNAGVMSPGGAWGAALAACGAAGDVPGLAQIYEERTTSIVERRGGEEEPCDENEDKEEMGLLISGCLEGLREATGRHVAMSSATLPPGGHRHEGATSVRHGGIRGDDTVGPSASLVSDTSATFSFPVSSSAQNTDLANHNEQHAMVTTGLASKKLVSALLARVESDALRYGGVDNMLNASKNVASLVMAHGNLGHVDAIQRLMHRCFNVMYHQSAKEQASKKRRSLYASSDRLLSVLSSSPSSSSKPPSVRVATMEASNCLVRPDARVFDAAIAGFGRFGRFDMIVPTLERMMELGLSPGPRTYAGMVTACAPPHGQPQPELAKKLIARMRRDGFSGPATVKPFNALLRVICLSDGVDAAEAVVHDMHHVGAVPDVATWTTLRAVALKQNRIDVAERADRELRALRQRGTHRRGFEVDGGDAGDGEAEEETAVVAGESEVGGKKLKEKDSMDTEEGEEGWNQGDAGDSKEKHWKSFYASDDEDEW